MGLLAALDAVQASGADARHVVIAAMPHALTLAARPLAAVAALAFTPEHDRSPRQ